MRPEARLSSAVAGPAGPIPRQDYDPNIQRDPQGPQEVVKAVPVGGRPSLYQPRFCIEVRRLALLGLANTERQMATFFGVSVSTIGAWKAQFPDFSDAMQGGKTPADCIVVEKLFEKACGYEWVEEQAIKVKEIICGDNGKKLRETERVEVVHSDSFGRKGASMLAIC